MDALRARFELDDLVHGSVEERAVVRDDDEARVESEQEPLEQLEAVEVEVVRRLVEQVDVEAREQNRGQRGSASLPAGELGDAPIELDLEADPPEHRSGARVELGAPTSSPVRRSRYASRPSPASTSRSCGR